MTQNRTETATLGGGCFWCLEAVYKDVRGVTSVASGYAGGHVANPTYQQVCEKNTGHAEVVRVEYDPDVVSFRDLLDVFFSIHDPTQIDRQGNDVGPQYRSVIFAETDAQKAEAADAIARLEAENVWDAPIATKVESLDVFWPAEDYHHDYFARNPNQPYCMAVVAPKVAKFRKQHLARLKA